MMESTIDNNKTSVTKNKEDMTSSSSSISPTRFGRLFRKRRLRKMANAAAAVLFLAYATAVVVTPVCGNGEGLKCTEETRDRGECCDAPVDITFILDKTGSVGEPNWNHIKDFFDHIVERFVVGDGQTHVGLILFACDVVPQWCYNEPTTTADLIARTKAINCTTKTQPPCGSGQTATGTAFRYAANRMLNNRTCGARQGVKNVVIVITEGGSTERQKDPIPDPCPPPYPGPHNNPKKGCYLPDNWREFNETDQWMNESIALLKSKDPLVIAYGVGRNASGTATCQAIANEKEIKLYATDMDHVFFANYTELKTKLGIIVKRACVAARAGVPNLTLSTGGRVQSGRDVTFKCTPTILQGNTYTFYKGDAKIDTGRSNSSNEYSIQNVTPMDTDVYACLDAKSNKRSVVELLEVIPPKPTLTANPPAADVGTVVDVEFTCAYKGQGTFGSETVDFFKGDTKVQNTSDNTYVENIKIVVDPVDSYTCTVTVKGLSSAKSNKVTIEPPTSSSSAPTTGGGGDQTDEDEDDNSAMIGLFAGLGALALLMAGAGCLYFVLSKRRKRKAEEEVAAANNAAEAAEDTAAAEADNNKDATEAAASEKEAEAADVEKAATPADEETTSVAGGEGVALAGAASMASMVPTNITRMMSTVGNATAGIFKQVKGQQQEESANDGHSSTDSQKSVGTELLPDRKGSFVDAPQPPPPKTDRRESLI